MTKRPYFKYQESLASQRHLLNEFCWSSFNLKRFLLHTMLHHQIRCLCMKFVPEQYITVQLATHCTTRLSIAYKHLHTPGSQWNCKLSWEREIKLKWLPTSTKKVPSARLASATFMIVFSTSVRTFHVSSLLIEEDPCPFLARSLAQSCHFCPAPCYLVALAEGAQCRPMYCQRSHKAPTMSPFQLQPWVETLPMVVVVTNQLIVVNCIETRDEKMGKVAAFSTKKTDFAHKSFM